MEEEVKLNETNTPNPVRSRPVILSVLCLFSFIYFGLLSLLFLAGLFKAGWIAGVMNQYLSTGAYTKTQTLLIFAAGFSLHGLAFAGIILILRLRIIGYYFLGLSSLVLATYQLTNPSTSITPTAFYIILILLFGIFYKRLH